MRIQTKRTISWLAVAVAVGLILYAGVCSPTSSTRCLRPRIASDTTVFGPDTIVVGLDTVLISRVDSIGVFIVYDDVPCESLQQQSTDEQGRQ